MNIIEQTEALKDLPDQRLMQEMQAPTGFAPQFLVLSELKRRKRMRDEYQRQQAANMKTVAEEAVTAAGVPQEGIMQMSQAMNPNSSIAQNTGADQRPQMQPTQAPQMMADGGVVRMLDGGMSGGTMSAIANLKANYPDVYRSAVEEGIVEQMAEYMLDIAQDAPYALDALEDPAPWFMKRPSQRSVDKKQLEIEESQPERALQARIDSRTALSRYGADDPIFGTSALEQRERPVTGQYTAAMDVPVTSAVRQPLQPNRRKGKVPLPSSDLLGSVPDMTERGVKTPSGSALSGLMPPVVDDGFGTESIQNMQEQERQDDIYKFLANPNSAAIADRLDEANLEGDEKYRKRILEGNLSAHTGLFFPKGSSGQEVAKKDVNLRALQFLQGDQYTPPSEIYGDLLGGDPLETAKYQEESPEVIQQLADDIYNANRVDQEDSALRSLDQQNMNAQRKSDEFFRMLEINNPPVAYDRSPTTEFINNLLSSGTDEVDNEVFKGQAIPEDLPEGFQLGMGAASEGAMGAASEGALSFGKLTDDTSTNPAGNKVTGGQKASATSSLGGIEGRIAKMLEEKEKSAQSDKWMALAQAGMALMASDAPTLGGAIGEAGLVGLGALKKGKEQYDKDVLDLLTLQQRIDAQKARSSGRGGLTASNMISLMDDLRRYKGDIQNRIDALNSPTNLMDPAEKERQIKGLQQELFRTDIELGTYRNALRGTGSIGSQSFDVRGGSAQQPSVGYSLGTASQ